MKKINYEFPPCDVDKAIEQLNENYMFIIEDGIPKICLEEIADRMNEPLIYGNLYGKKFVALSNKVDKKDVKVQYILPFEQRLMTASIFGGEINIPIFKR